MPNFSCGTAVRDLFPKVVRRVREVETAGICVVFAMDHFNQLSRIVSTTESTRALDPGIDGMVVNLVTNGHQPGIVELAGRTLEPLVRG